MNGQIPQELQVWYDRWQALDDQMARMEETFRTLSLEIRGPTLLNLIQCLRVFAAGQFNFFGECFGPGGPCVLQEDKDYPREYVLHGVISQISHDVHVIQRAANQRKMAFDQGLNSPMQTALDRADRLAWDALQPAVQAGLIVPKEGDGPATVLVYFEKLQSIRIIPYAPVALIAVNFTAMNDHQGYLAIPHEVGHYVFWRGQGIEESNTLGQELSKRTGGAPWTEEVFADVYGCSVAGPVMALDFQDMQLERKPEKFDYDDKEHATPILRPYIYTHVLEKTQSVWAGPLKNLWDNRRGMRPGTILDPDARTAAISITDAASDLLLDHHVGWGNATWWAQDVNPPSDGLVSLNIRPANVLEVGTQIGDALYKNGFNARFDSDGSPERTIPKPPPLEKSCNWDSNKIDEYVADRANSPTGRTDPWWIEVALARGWTTHGNSRWLQI